MRILKIIGNCLFGLIVIVLLTVIFFTFINRNEDIPKIGNYSLLQVDGNSMLPSIKDGDLIAIDRRSKEIYEVGDVVSFKMDDGAIITHQIIKVSEVNGSYHYFTKGINNNYQDNDYIEIKQIIGEYKGFRIPALGYIVGFGSTKIGYLLLVIIPLGGVLVMVMWELFKEVKKRGEY